jgi:hypothetical protein
MATKKHKKGSSPKPSTSNSEGVDLSQFIEKKRIQTEALKKIMSKLNSEGNSNTK